MSGLLLFVVCNDVLVFLSDVFFELVGGVHGVFLELRGVVREADAELSGELDASAAAAAEARDQDVFQHTRFPDRAPVRHREGAEVAATAAALAYAARDAVAVLLGADLAREDAWAAAAQQKHTGIVASLRQQPPSPGLLRPPVQGHQIVRHRAYEALYLQRVRHRSFSSSNKARLFSDNE